MRNETWAELMMESRENFGGKSRASAACSGIDRPPDVKEKKRLERVIAAYADLCRNRIDEATLSHLRDVTGILDVPSAAFVSGETQKNTR
jgi:hypothetical protein